MIALLNCKGVTANKRTMIKMVVNSWIQRAFEESVYETTVIHTNQILPKNHEPRLKIC